MVYEEHITEHKKIIMK